VKSDPPLPLVHNVCVLRISRTVLPHPCEKEYVADRFQSAGSEALDALALGERIVLLGQGRWIHFPLPRE
jgi:hypothetical protein